MSLRLKQQLIQELCERVAAELSAATRAAHNAHDAATHEEAKPENDKDTRSVEAAYLAGAQASRAAELQSTVTRLQSLQLLSFDETTPLGATALIDVQEGETRKRYFLLPVAGGLSVELEGRRVDTITPSSPLGSLLAGSLVGDDLELETPRGIRELSIVGAE